MGFIDYYYTNMETSLGSSSKADGNEEPTSPETMEKFDEEVFKWVTEDPSGQYHFAQNHVGFINKKIHYQKVVAKSIGKISDPKNVKEPIYNQW